MRAAIYNPYLDTLGGGERYTLTFAKVLAEVGYEVDIEWKENSILNKLSKRFGLKFPSNLKIVDSVNRGENYDLIFWVSDGSIPTLRARKNYLHFQVPFHDVNGGALLNKMKLFRVDKIICNSNFTKKIIDMEYGVNSIVIYPPVDIQKFKPKRKEKTILYVGRFSGLKQSKSQDILIKGYKKLVADKKFMDWKLVLAGGVEVGADKFLPKLEKMAKGLNVEFVKSPSFQKLQELYGRAKIFWSAAGYNVDERRNPERVEHFGITLVESMSAGCVPIIYNVGGPKEIILDKVNGFLWNSKSELTFITKSIVLGSGIIRKVSVKAIESSQKYGYNNFKNKVTEILK